MILSNNTLQLDIKVQDLQREKFAKLAGDITAACVVLGDSDVEYQLSPDNVINSGVLSAPYSVPGIKHKLLYNGVGKDLSGTIKCFVRKVLSDGTIQSLYEYPLDEDWITGSIPPVLANGKNFDQITFDDTQSGYILFFETVLDYYLTTDGIKERLVELYDISIDWNGSGVIPVNWDLVIDNVNGSLLLSKLDTSGSPIGFVYRGTVTVTGQFSKKQKKITFNF